MPHTSSFKAASQTLFKVAHSASKRRKRKEHGKCNGIDKTIKLHGSPHKEIGYTAALKKHMTMGEKDQLFTSIVVNSGL